MEIPGTLINLIEWTATAAGLVKSTYILVAQPLHVALQKRGLANGHSYIALDIKVKVRLQVGDRRQFQMTWAGWGWLT